MEAKQNKPTPVSFKSFSSASKENTIITCFKLIHFSVEIQKNKDNNPCYLLTSYSDSAHPLKLYQSAINKLMRQLDFAFEKAKELECQDDLTDNEHYDCGIVNKYGKMEVRLVLSTFRQHCNIWLRLYMLDENGNHLPTRTGVRFSPDDDIQAFSEFIAANK